MTDQGPVCHLPSPTVGASHDPVSLPAIPPAQPNLHSLTATVNAMRQVLLIYTGQRGPQGTAGAQGKAGKNAPSGSWTEISRVTEKVKVYQNNDPSSPNWVEVERLNKLTMQNKDTKQTWTWDRERK